MNDKDREKLLRELQSLKDLASDKCEEIEKTNIVSMLDILCFLDCITYSYLTPDLTALKAMKWLQIFQHITGSSWAPYQKYSGKCIDTELSLDYLTHF